MFGSLFIVTGKRYAELRELGEEAAATRTTLAQYSVGFLRIVAGGGVRRGAGELLPVGVRDQGQSGQDWPFYELSIVPMLTALLRYALVLEQGHGGAPEEVFARDRVLQLLGLSGWSCSHSACTCDEWGSTRRSPAWPPWTAG